MVISALFDVADIGEGLLRSITVCRDSTRTCLRVGSVSIWLVGGKQEVVDGAATRSKGRKREGVTIGSDVVLESITDSRGLDGSSARVMDKSLEFRAFSVKDPDSVFQSCASLRDAGNCMVSEDMLLELYMGMTGSGWGHSAVR